MRAQGRVSETTSSAGRGECRRREGTHESHHGRLERARHGRLDDSRVGREGGEAVEKALDDRLRLDRVDKEAVEEREEHVDDVGHDEHLRLLEAGLWGVRGVRVSEKFERGSFEQQRGR